MLKPAFARQATSPEMTVRRGGRGRRRGGRGKKSETNGNGDEAGSLMKMGTMKMLRQKFSKR
jgi:hypothetical protein